MKSETRYTRKGKIIIDIVTGKAKDHKSVNEAKRESHRIQMDEDKGLGHGVLQLTVVEAQKQEIQLDKATIARMRSGR